MSETKKIKLDGYYCEECQITVHVSEKTHKESHQKETTMDVKGIKVTFQRQEDDVSFSFFLFLFFFFFF